MYWAHLWTRQRITRTCAISTIKMNIANRPVCLRRKTRRNACEYKRKRNEFRATWPLLVTPCFPTLPFSLLRLPTPCLPRLKAFVESVGRPSGAERKRAIKRRVEGIEQAADRSTMAVRAQYEGSNEIGVFTKLTNTYCLVAIDGSENFYRCVTHDRQTESGVDRTKERGLRYSLFPFFGTHHTCSMYALHVMVHDGSFGERVGSDGSEEQAL